MYQRDFIMRMIEMIGELVAGILGMLRKKDFDKAEQAIEDAFHTYLKEDAAFFTKIPINELTDNLLQEHNYTIGHLEILAELFYVQAELNFAQNKKSESLEFYQKSLLLLEFVIKESKSFSAQKESRILLIRDRIKEIKG